MVGMNEQRHEPDAEVSRADEPAPMLGYRSGIDESRDRPPVPVPLQAVLSFFGSAAAIFASGYVAIFASGSLMGGFGGVVIVSVVLGLIARHLGKRADENQRGWPIGIWLGIGIVGLLDGLCFVALAGM